VSGPRTFVGPNAPREQAVRYLVRERLPVPAEYVRDLLDVLDAAREAAKWFEADSAGFYDFYNQGLIDAIKRFEAGAQEETT
jgi:hypothetical protein